jgi:hypothetical protein
VHDVEGARTRERSAEAKTGPVRKATVSESEQPTEQPWIPSERRDRIPAWPRRRVPPGIDVSDPIQQTVAADCLVDDIRPAFLATEERNIVAPIEQPRHLPQQEGLRPLGKRVQEKRDPEPPRRSVPLACGYGHGVCRAEPERGFVARSVTVTGKSGS